MMAVACTRMRHTLERGYMRAEDLLGDDDMAAMRAALDAGGPEADVLALEEACRRIRLRVKRGPVFRPAQALHEGKADCLAYAQLLQTAARDVGLDVGIIEVVVDSAGRYVHHPANLFKPSAGRPWVVDLWYGSTDIRHRRLAALVREGSRWRVRDFDHDAMPEARRVRGLPRRCVRGLTWYTHGNVELGRGRPHEAIACYDRAARLYPENPRISFNRALAHEAAGDDQRARADRDRAFASEETLPRLLASAHDEVTALIRLDEAEVLEEDQRLYLLSQGFITGQPVPLPEIAERCGAQVEEVAARLDAIGKRLCEQ